MTPHPEAPCEAWYLEGWQQARVCRHASRRPPSLTPRRAPQHEVALSPAHRRHPQLLAAAGTLVGLGALAELQGAWHADSKFAQARSAAGDRDARAGKSRVRRNEGVLDLVRRNSELVLRRQIDRRDLHRGACLANGLEIAARRQAGADPVLVPLVEDQPRRRHQIQHRRDDGAIEPRRRVLAEFRKALFVLWPQPMHHERIGPLAALLAWRALARLLAIGRRPRQREYIEVELAGLVLPRVLSGRAAHKPKSK